MTDNIFNFRQVPSITVTDKIYENGTWKFAIPAITAGTGSTPSWIDVVLSGTMSLTLVNAKADGLNYVKLYGGCERDYTPEILNYETVDAMAHSTFDTSKFTIAGSPTISADGIVTGFSASNYLKTPTIDFSQPWEIKLRIKRSNSTSDWNYFVSFGTNGRNAVYFRNDGTRIDFSELSMTATDWAHAGVAGAEYDAVVYWDGDNYGFKLYNLDGTLYASSSFASTTACANSEVYIGWGKQSGYMANGSIDLKYVSITTNGVLAFSGNKTGTDTYTIGGSTVTIPYTLSKTGSKIVDDAYRTQVSALYAQEGIAPYYTLQEGVDFTLPQGEVYGMIQNAYQNVLPNYSSGGITMGFPASPTTTASTFTAPSAGWAYIHGERAGGTGGTLHVYVNNAPVAIFVGHSSFGSSTIFPVSKNDIISVDVDVNSTWTINDQYFYPSKGV